MTERTADYMEVAERLYRHANPESKKDVPSMVYEMVERWYKQWLDDKVTKLDFFDWCIVNKQPKK
jgi:hypothetical protein